jgi:hypothetical protein
MTIEGQLGGMCLDIVLLYLPGRIGAEVSILSAECARLLSLLVTVYSN